MKMTRRAYQVACYMQLTAAIILFITFVIFAIPALLAAATVFSLFAAYDAYRYGRMTDNEE